MALLLSAGVAHAQSTFGSYVGTIKDPSGAVILGATVTLTNTGTGAARVTHTNQSGDYAFENIDAGSYRITVDVQGYQKLEFTNLTLLARETQRVDGTPKVGQNTEVVTVSTAAAVINTDTSNIAQTRTGIELTTLPIAISSIQGGSTSPYSTLQSQAGVQISESGTLNVAGSTSSMINVSVDGISTMNVTSSTVAPEMFPSFNSIEEIKVSQNANSAEFGGTSDITTVSKGGTNKAHGGVFDNYQSKGFNSNSPFTPTNKANLVLNDFGAFYGGPVSVPKLYNGHDKTFYFLSYEGLRLPQQSTSTLSVPTAAERNGDFSIFPQQLYHADGTTPWVNNQIPVAQWNSTSAYLLNHYYPMPNANGTAINNNYIVNIATPIKSDQGDVRLDQKITDKQSVYVRYSYKQRATQAALNSGLGGTTSSPQKNTSLTGSYSYILSPTLLNEFRAGLSKYITSTTFNSNSSVIAQAGIQGIPDLLPTTVAAEPGITITGITSVSGSSSVNSSNTYEFTDNLTWNHGKHTFKGGADYRRLYAFASNVFGSRRLGTYSFTGSNAVGAAMLNLSATTGPNGAKITPATSGVQVASFVQGVPDTTGVTDVSQPNQNGRGNAWAFFVQDDWKITNTLVISYGLRYEYHPPFTDKYSNVANFLPDYFSGTGTGGAIRGAVVVPNDYAIAHNVLAAFRTYVAPYPIVTAAQAGEPEALTRPTKDDFAPRLGFAWRPLHNDNTVIRGGIGHFIVPVLGQEIDAGWAVSASAVETFNNSYQAGTKTPVIAFPTPFATTPAAQAALYFDLGQTTHYRDPTMEQWNLTVEQNIGYHTGMRISYVGNHAQKLNATPNTNQIPYQSLPANAVAPPQSSEPYPYLGEITTIENLGISNYNALTIEANHRMTKGLQFQSSYTYAHNLSNSTISNVYNPLQDYGNVVGTRRNRFLASAVYNLPFGHNQSYLSHSNFFIDRAVSNWSTSVFYVGQGGDFLTPSQSSGQGDPTGTANFASYGAGSTIRPDITGVSPYGPSGYNGPARGARNRLAKLVYTPNAQGVLVATGVSAYQPVMATAKAAAPGRQGNTPVGSLIGNGTQSLSMSLMKGIAFTERAKLDFGVQVQNILNHHNYADPSVSIGTPATFGTSTSMQGQGDSGMRSMMLTGRLSF